MKRAMIPFILCVLMLSLGSCHRLNDSNLIEKQPYEDTAETSVPAVHGPDVMPEEETPFYQMATMDDSAAAFVDLVEAKGYKTIERHSIMTEKQNYSCVWIFAVNDEGEFLDYVMMDPEKEALLEQVFSEGLQGWRKEECGKFGKELGFIMPIMGPGSTQLLEYQNHFVWRIQGSTFAFEDVGIEPFLPIYWHEKEQVLKTRPDGYPLSSGYLQQKTINEDIDALKQKLEDSEYKYRWEEENHIVINNESYPVTWLSVTNEDDEYADIIWSEDPSFGYVLSQYAEYFLSIHEEDAKRYLARTGADENLVLLQWIVKDCFYNGYCVFYTGRGFPLIDCGVDAYVFECDPSGTQYVQWYDRTNYYDWTSGERITVNDS